MVVLGLQGAATSDPIQEAASEPATAKPPVSSRPRADPNYWPYAIPREQEEELGEILDREADAIEADGRVMNPKRLKEVMTTVHALLHAQIAASPPPTGDDAIPVLELDRPRTVSFAGMPPGF